MIDERRAFVAMNWGVAKVIGELRNGAATFTPRIFALKHAKSQCSSAFPARTQQKRPATFGKRSPVARMKQSVIRGGG